MAQKPIVRDAVLRILETSGRTDAELVIGFTHRALAARVYDTDRPTVAQLSSVRRAVARLVADGRAERGEREWATWGSSIPWRIDTPPGADRWPEGYDTHWRARGEDYEFRTFNPGGITIFRAETDEDKAARRRWEKQDNTLAQTERALARNLRKL